MISDSDEGQEHRLSMLINDERVWFARTANCNHGDWGPESASSVGPVHDGLSLAVPISLVPWYEGKTSLMSFK